jgi:RNA polymerase sigma-70 factor (ECF subfamily)
MIVQPELIKDCINRNRRAEYDLYKLTYRYLMSICIRYSRDEDTAKEALNIGFLKILNNLSKYNTEAPFKTWIRRIMINTLVDEFRKQKHHESKIQYVEEYDESSYAELNKVIEKIDGAEIYAVINRLPPASKEVFNLYVIDGYSHKEISELLNISEGTSKWHLNAARNKLKDLLDPIVSNHKVAYNG